MKTMKKLFSAIICFAAISLIFLGFGFFKPASAQKIEWTYPTQHVPGNYMRAGQDWFAAEVYKRSNEGLKIFTHQFSEVGLTGFESLTVLKPGAYPIIEVITGWVAGEIPAFGLYSAPCVVDNPKEGVAALDATRDIRQRELDKFNAMELRLYTVGPLLTLFSNKPVRTLEDFKGLKIRAPGRLIGDFVKALGGSPMTTPLAESYTALQRGTVDAGLTGPDGGLSLKWNEATKYATLMGVSPNVTFVVVNKDRWKALPKDIQDITLQVAKEATDRLTNDAIKVSATAKDDLRAAGLTVIELTPEVAAQIRGIVKGNLWDKWAGVPEGQKLLKAIREATSK